MQMKAWTEIRPAIEAVGKLLDCDEGADGGVACRVRSESGTLLQVIFSWGGGWDHVSVTRVGDARPPFWNDMAWVKDLFFEPEEPAYQFHPPRSQYVNLHPGCLHIFRPQDSDVSLPPVWMV